LLAAGVSSGFFGAAAAWRTAGFRLCFLATGFRVTGAATGAAISSAGIAGAGVVCGEDESIPKRISPPKASATRTPSGEVLDAGGEDCPS
jgi:hypothetical protein